MQCPLQPQVLNFCFQTRLAVAEVEKVVPATKRKVSTMHSPHMLRDENRMDISYLSWKGQNSTRIVCFLIRIFNIRTIFESEYSKLNFCFPVRLIYFSDTFQRTNSVFLSQQISISISISQIYPVLRSKQLGDRMQDHWCPSVSNPVSLPHDFSNN